MSRGEPRTQTAPDLDSFIRRQPPDAAQQRPQVLAVHEFHGDELLAIRFADVVHATNAGVRNLARNAHFAVEPVERYFVVRYGFGQKLQRYRLAQFEIIGAIDLAHAALSEDADDAVTLGQKHARRKPALDN